jgi:hypothetical protein
MPGDRRLQILAVGHLALGVVTSVLAHVELRAPSGLRHLPEVPLFASALCQALLLSFWVAVSQASPWMRLAGLFAGPVYLEALLPADLRREFLGTSTITIIVSTATLLVVRWLGVRFRRQDDSSQSAQPEPEGLKFSIRGLMSFTAVVALICAVAKALEGSRNLFLLTLVWALCFVAVGLISLWAVLGNAHPRHRGPVAFVLSPMLGASFAFAAGARQSGWIYILLIMLLYPVALLVSLLVVRSCGYRLVRRPMSSTGPPDDGGRCEMVDRATPV